MTLLAVDPGSSGGLALWSNKWDERQGEHKALAWPYPETEGDCLEAIRKFSLFEQDRVAVVEAQVGVMGPNIKVSSAAMFTFGRNYGFMLGVLQSLNWKIHLIRPMAWQKVLSTGAKKDHGKGWKNHLKAMAQRLYPEIKVTLKTADALLILEYGRRMQLGAPQMKQDGAAQLELR